MPCCSVMEASGIGTCQRSTAARPGSTAGRESSGPRGQQAPGTALGPPPTDRCSPQKPGRWRPRAGEGAEPGDLGQRSEPLAGKRGVPSPPAGRHGLLRSGVVSTWSVCGQHSPGPSLTRWDSLLCVALGDASQVTCTSTCLCPMSGQARGVTQVTVGVRMGGANSDRRGRAPGMWLSPRLPPGQPSTGRG